MFAITVPHLGTRLEDIQACVKVKVTRSPVRRTDGYRYTYSRVTRGK
jgi:hypothetical protein